MNVKGELSFKYQIVDLQKELFLWKSLSKVQMIMYCFISGLFRLAAEISRRNTGLDEKNK